jgi:sugar lactone lactonase YvrE
MAAMVCLGAARVCDGQTLVFNPGMVTSVAGNGGTTYSTASYAGVATAAALNFPRRIAIDASGNLYWMEKGGQIARVLASGKGAIPALPGVASPTAGWVYTIAGDGATTACTAKLDAFGDGCPAAQSYMTAPYGVAVDTHGNVYLDDTGDYLIRVVYAGGTVPNLPSNPVVGNVYAVAGTGATGSSGDGGPALSAQIGSSHGVTVDAQGNIYFTDSGNGRVRVVYAAGTIPEITNPAVGSVYTITGTATACASATAACGDNGPAISAQINGPDSVAVDASGNVFFGDTGDLRLRAIYVAGSLPGIAHPVTGDIYTVAGNGVSGSGPDGVQATASSLTSGMGQPFIDAVGNVYVPDGTSNTVRKIDPSGVITTVMGGAMTVCAAHTNAAGDGCAANAVTLSGESGIVLDTAGNAYVADYKDNLIRLLTPGASALNFSGPIGATNLQQTVILSNAGTQSLKLTGITLSGPFAQGTAGTTVCSTSTILAAGASCQIPLNPAATSVGTATGSLVIASNALNASSGQNTIQLASVTTLGATTTSFSVSPTLANLGQTVTLTASVSVPAGISLSPTGTVTFLSGSTSIGSATLAGGKATFTSSTLAAGSYSVTASYGGDANFAGSVSTASSFTVSATPVPIVTLTSSLATVQVGQAVTLTATALPFSGSKLPTGTITFQEGSNILGQSALNASGVATLQVSSLPAGVNTLLANFGGDATFLAVGSPTIVVTSTTGAQLIVFPGKLLTVAGSHTLGAGYSGDGAAATSAQVKTPLGLALDTAGDLFIADSANNRIRRVDAVTGFISTVAGTGTACATASLPCGDGGKATLALLNGPQAVRVDAAGNLYILDKGDHAVRKVSTSTGLITTIVGTLGTAGYTGDGAAATSAKLNGPRGLYLDNGNNLYISDSGNAVVRRVDSLSGVIATIAGTGSTLGDGGPATSAQLVNPRGLTLDSDGNLYIADIGSYRVRRVDAVTGLITTVAGNGTACTSAPCGDGGMATSAGLGGPQDVVVATAGDLILSDPNLNAVRRVSPVGIITTIAGEQSTTAGYTADGGAATSGLLSYPNSLLLDGKGNLYLSEANNSLVREVLSGTTSLNFGSLNLGSTASQTVALASTGNQPVTISAIAVAAGYTQQPSGSADCAAQLTLNQGATCLLDVQFQPLLAGTSSGAVNVTSNAINTPGGLTLVSLSGTGTAYSGTTPQTVSFAALPNVTYGAAPIALSATASSGLAIIYSSITGPAVLSGSTLKIIGAGQVSITAYQFGSSTYAAATPVTQSFTVAPAPLTVTANNASRAVGAPNPTFTYTLNGFVAGDTQSVVSGTPVLSTSANNASLTGSYPITVAVGTLAAANYTFVFVNGTLTVNGQPQTIAFGSLANATYGATPISLSATSSSGLPVSYSAQGPASVSNSTLSITGAGAVTVTATQAGNSSYAAATPVSQCFQVAPATLTVTAANASRPIDAANPTFIYTLSGLVNGDTASVVTGTPVFSTTATSQSPTGTYPITPGLGTLQAANYIFTFVGASLTVTPDFSLSSNLPGLTLNRGVTGHLMLTLTPLGPYQGSVTLSCSILPLGVSCVFTPATLVADGSGNIVTGTLDINTNGALSRMDAPNFDHRSKVMAASIRWLPGGLAALMLLLRRRRFAAHLWMKRLTVLALLLAGLGAASGCSSTQAYVAPVVTTMTVTATASAGSSTHTLNLNLTVI